MTLIDARTTTGRTAPTHTTPDEFEVDCVNVWPSVTLDANDPVLRDEDWLAIAHAPFGEHVEAVEYLPANLPA